MLQFKSRCRWVVCNFKTVWMPFGTCELEEMNSLKVEIEMLLQSRNFSGFFLFLSLPQKVTPPPPFGCDHVSGCITRRDSCSHKKYQIIIKVHSLMKGIYWLLIWLKIGRITRRVQNIIMDYKMFLAVWWTVTIVIYKKGFCTRTLYLLLLLKFIFNN